MAYPLLKLNGSLFKFFSFFYRQGQRRIPANPDLLHEKGQQR